MDLTIVDDPITYLCNASRSFALLNNCVCYSLCYLYVYYGRQYFQNYNLQLNTDFINSLTLFFKNVNTAEKMYFLLSTCLLVLMILMIFANHKFRSKFKPNVFTIKLWLIVHGVVFYFVLVSFIIPSITTITKKYDVLLVGIITDAILAYEMYVVKCLYNEVRLQNMSVFDLINFTSMRHSAQSTYQSSHLAAIYSTMALIMWYFLWIFFILRKRMNPKPPNNMSIQDRTSNTGNKDYTSVYCT
ncbi:uncharacterized protein LOC114129884 [Aphis gossypii]|uniref:Uncharacterized protein n=1 Tax=Aphis gossypii TaxID=80765 RepID=A0A9P0J301_APHGO|nr:uncharacterized protein LOC114129884 [Aphis gossypii]CAH1725655.1 unnamed protein product [Aphis gossypii]